jgi:hypothetical protein
VVKTLQTFIYLRWRKYVLTFTTKANSGYMPYFMASSIGATKIVDLNWTAKVMELGG